MMQKKIQQNKGFALLLAIIVSSVVLAIGVSLLQISISQINLASTARESEIAFQAANAGVDCMWYWRNAKSNEFITGNSGNPVTIDCFGATLGSSLDAPIPGNTNVHHYTYKLDWGTPARCTEMSLYVFDAQGGAVSYNFATPGISDSVGVAGTKTCTAGGVCTVLISDGYNRSCTSYGSSVFSIQRELTVEF